jgi:hypothetical protein
MAFGDDRLIGDFMLAISASVDLATRSALAGPRTPAADKQQRINLM